MPLKDPRTCRIFFSSPFGGMEEEREELTRKYFPQIHHLCNSKGIQFVAVDMRWGITVEAAKNAQVINICLRELDRSDIFVGFFGQRYGWHGSQDELLQRNFDAAVGRYPFLDRFRDKSVTELEYLHGHLNNPGQMPACICFRDKAYDDKIREEGERTNNKGLLYKYSAEEDSPPLMDDLKERVERTEPQTLGVMMSYPNPKEGAKFMFGAIWRYLTERLLDDSSQRELSRREEELLQHRAFLDTRSGLYVGGQEYMGALNRYLSSTSEKPILVKGDKGSGKSALLCTWIKQLTDTQEDLLISYHFVGFADGSTGIPNILKRLHENLEFQIGNAIEDDKSEESYDKSNLMDIIRHRSLELNQTLKQVATAGKRAVIVVDALNMVDSPGKVGKHLFWLPETLPEGVYLVVSSVSSDDKTHKELVEKRLYSTIDVEPLIPNHQQEMCTKTLMTTGKELSDDQLKRTVDAENTKTPLFLKIVLEELCMFGSFSDLDKKIDSLIHSQSVEDLFTKYLERLDADYNVKEYSGYLVEQVMCSLALSHDGLSENELSTMFSIPSHVWSPLSFALDKYLVNRSGLLGFGFDELKTAVVKRYMENPDIKEKYCQTIIDYFKKTRKDLGVTPVMKDSLQKRPCQELPWLYLSIGDTQGLISVLSDLVIFQALYNDGVYELLELWKKTELSGKEIAEHCLRSFDDLLASVYCDNLENWDDGKNPPGFELLEQLTTVQELLNIGRFIEGQEMVLLRQRDILDNLEGKMKEETRNDTLNSINYSLGCLYCDMGIFDKAEPLQSANLEFRGRWQKIEGHKPTYQELRDLAVAYHGIAVVNLSIGNYDKAEELLNQSMKLHEQVPQDVQEKTAECLLNIGNVYMSGRQDYPKALEYFTEALKRYEEAYYGQLPLSIGNLLTNIAVIHRKMENIDEAEKFYKRSLEIKVNAVGRDHPSTALAYINLSTMETYRNNIPKAEEYCREALRIYELNGYLDHMKEVIMARENLALNLASRQQKHEEAFPHYWAAFHALVEKDEMRLCLPTLHAEMARYSLEKGRFEDARKITMAMLACDQIWTDRNFIHLHYLDSQVPEEQRPERPHKQTLEFALTVWPHSRGLVEYTAQSHMLPRGDIQGLLKMAEDFHKATDGSSGEDFFKDVAIWCDAAGNKDVMLDVFELGLKYYPTSKLFLANILILMREKDQVIDAVPYAVRLFESSMDESRFQMYATECVAMAAKFDMAREFLNKIGEAWGHEEGMTERVQKVLATLDEAESQMATKENETNEDTES